MHCTFLVQNGLVQFGTIWHFIDYFYRFFLHGGLFHILSNILCQVYLGFLVEKALSSTKLSTKVFNSEITFTGSLKVAVCYFLSSVGGVLLSAVGDQTQLTIGASCAVCGLIGVLCAFLFLIWLGFLAPSCFCWNDNDRKDIQLFRALCIFSILGGIFNGFVWNSYTSHG